jgi:hypothetical protein
MYARAPIGVGCAPWLQWLTSQVTHRVPERLSLVPMLLVVASSRVAARRDESGTLLSVSFLDGERFLHSRPRQHSLVMRLERWIGAWRGVDAKSESPVDAEEMDIGD